MSQSQSAIDPVAVLAFAALVPLALSLIPLSLYTLRGFLVVQPRTQVVVLRFGQYRRTIIEEGIHYVFPLGRRLLRVTSSVVSVDLPKMTVLEANGSPIEVSAICSYRVASAQRALLDVDNFGQFVSLLAGAVLKNVCAEYPYDAPDPRTPCLRKESEVVTGHMIRELQTVVAPAGVQILQMRINDLTYAPEVASAMLMRQQAVAMVEARRTIVEGSVATVCSASEAMQAAGFEGGAPVSSSFAANLMLVLCSGERVQTFMPVQVESSHG